MLLYTSWATNELRAVLSLIQGAYFFLCTQGEVLFKYLFFLFQISVLRFHHKLGYALIAFSSLTMNSWLFRHLTHSSLLFSISAFPHRSTQLSSTLGKRPIWGTKTSTTVGTVLCQAPRMGSAHKHHFLGKDQFPLRQSIHLSAVTVGCKPGLCGPQGLFKWERFLYILRCCEVSARWWAAPGTPRANTVTQAEPSCAEHWPAGLLVRLRQSAWYTLGQPGFLQETSCPPSPQLKHSSSRSFITSACDLRFICGRLFSFLDFSSVRVGWLCRWDNVS